VVGIAPAIGALLVLPAASRAGARNGRPRSPWSRSSWWARIIGAFNGILVVKFKLNAFIVTLAMLIVLRGCWSAPPRARRCSACPTPSSPWPPPPS
jgi:simple sugar transport system permease protein